MKQTEWILCPVCGSKTCSRIREDTILINYPLYCSKCRKERVIEVRNLQTIVITEPDTLDADDRAVFKKGCTFRLVRVKEYGKDIWGQMHSGYWVPLVYKGKMVVK